MKIKNIRNSVLVMMLSLSTFMLPAHSVYAYEETVTVSIPIMQSFDFLSENSNGIDTTGVYELQSMDDNAPMPNDSKEQSYTFQIDEKNEPFLLQFHYGHAGIYKYQLHQVTPDKENYTYDENMYNVTVYIKNAKNGTLSNQIIVQNSQGDKCAEISFNNSYQRKNEEIPKLDAPRKSNPIKTGDTNAVELFVTMFICSSVLLILVSARKKQKG